LGAFEGCSTLASVAFSGNALQTIGASAFRWCRSLASVSRTGESSASAAATFPDALQEIGEEAFQGCSSLASVAFPDALREIGDEAFQGCSSLVSASVFLSTAFNTLGNLSFPANCVVTIRQNIQVEIGAICTICQDSLTDEDHGYLVQLGCGDIFHSVCIQTWQSENETRTYVNYVSFPRCPNCRAASQNLGRDNIYRLIQLRF